jgi:hypothetical protein
LFCKQQRQLKNRMMQGVQYDQLCIQPCFQPCLRRPCSCCAQPSRVGVAQAPHAVTLPDPSWPGSGLAAVGGQHTLGATLSCCSGAWAARQCTPPGCMLPSPPPWTRVSAAGDMPFHTHLLPLAAGLAAHGWHRQASSPMHVLATDCLPAPPAAAAAFAGCRFPKGACSALPPPSSAGLGLGNGCISLASLLLPSLLGRTAAAAVVI